MSIAVPLDGARDKTLLAQVMGRTLDHLRREIGGRPLVSAARARLRVVRLDTSGRGHTVPWRYGLPLPEGAVMLVCVADAVIRT